MYCQLRLLVLLSCLLAGHFHTAAAELKEGLPAPAFRAELLDGAKFDSANLLGKVIVLNFWATWCTPCREEMPAIDAFYRAHRGEGLEVIALSIDDPRDIAKVRRVVKDFSFAVAMTPGTQIAGYGRLSRVPVTFVIDRQGVLRLDGLKFAKLLNQTNLESLVAPLLRHSTQDIATSTRPLEKRELLATGR